MDKGKTQSTQNLNNAKKTKAKHKVTSKRQNGLKQKQNKAKRKVDPT
jgi:hypothetical protein